MKISFSKIITHISFIIIDFFWLLFFEFSGYIGHDVTHTTHISFLLAAVIAFVAFLYYQVLWYMRRDKELLLTAIAVSAIVLCVGFFVAFFVSTHVDNYRAGQDYEHKSQDDLMEMDINFLDRPNY